MIGYHGVNIGRLNYYMFNHIGHIVYFNHIGHIVLNNHIGHIVFKSLLFYMLYVFKEQVLGVLCGL